MTDCTFLRHFETRVEPDRPVREWQVSDAGREALEQYVADSSFERFNHVLTSPEPKAEVAARKISEKSGLPIMVVDGLAEVDRTEQGFVESQDRYEAMAVQYLQSDTVPFGWENRIDVVERWCSFIEWADAIEGPIITVAHGLFLASVLPRFRGKDPVRFWQNLAFGEELQVDLDEISSFLQPDH